MHDLYEGVAASTATIGMKEVEEEKKISLNLELSKIKEFSPLLCFRDGRLWLWLKWLFKVIFGGGPHPNLTTRAEMKTGDTLIQVNCNDLSSRCLTMTIIKEGRCWKGKKLNSVCPADSSLSLFGTPIFW